MANRDIPQGPRLTIPCLNLPTHGTADVIKRVRCAPFYGILYPGFRISTGTTSVRSLTSPWTAARHLSAIFRSCDSANAPRCDRSENSSVTICSELRRGTKRIANTFCRKPADFQAERQQEEIFQHLLAAGVSSGRCGAARSARSVRGSVRGTRGVLS